MAFNPKNYGASNTNGVFNGNAKRIVDVSTISGSNVLTSPGGGFAGAVIGQTIWVSSRLAQTTITTVVSNNEVHTVGLASSSGNLCECVFGGDDTGAFQAAFAAATASGRKTTMEVPNANTILTDRFFNYSSGGFAPNLVGEDDGTCWMFVSPNIAIPGDGSGVLIRSTGGSNRFANFVVWCPFQTYGMIDTQAMFQADGGGVQIQNIQAINCFSSGASGAIRTFEGNFAAQSTNVYAFFDAPGSVPAGNTCRGWLINNTTGTMLKPFFSNLYSALDVTNLVTRRGIGGQPALQILGGFFDENGGPPANVVLHGNASLQMVGTLVWTSSAPGNYAVSVDPTSQLWLEQCGLGPYAANTAGARGLKIDAGGIAHASGSTFWCTDNVSDISVLNNGTFNDYGGNDYKNALGGFVAVPHINAIANLDRRWQNSITRGNTELLA
jgi:hypothetical protein